LHALRTFKEGGRSGDEDVQPRETTSINLIEQLTKGVQRLLSDVATNPLKSLDLVEHKYQPSIIGIAEDREEPLQEAEGAEVIEVASDAYSATDACGDVGLPTEPGDEAVSRADISTTCRIVITPQCGGECWGGA
jgi:hypothetical protein